MKQISETTKLSAQLNPRVQGRSQTAGIGLTSDRAEVASTPGVPVSGVEGSGTREPLLRHRRRGWHPTVQGSQRFNTPPGIGRSDSSWRMQTGRWSRLLESSMEKKLFLTEIFQRVLARFINKV